MLQFNMHPFQHFPQSDAHLICIWSLSCDIGYVASIHIFLMTLPIKNYLFFGVTISSIWVIKNCDNAISKGHLAKSVGCTTFYLTTRHVCILLSWFLEIDFIMFCFNTIEYKKNWSALYYQNKFFLSCLVSQLQQLEKIWVNF